MPGRTTKSNRGGGLPGDAQEVLQLVLEYAKQETIGPLRGLARFALWGIAGSVALSAGIVLLLVGLLRALQTETGSAFHGDRSWLPYVITLVVAVLVAASAAMAIPRGAARRSGRKPGGARP